MQLHIGTQLHMDPHVLFKLGTHTCDSSDKRLAITLSVRVFQKQTLFMWVHFLVAMTTEHSPFPPQQTSYTLLHHHGTPTEPHDLIVGDTPTTRSIYLSHKHVGFYKLRYLILLNSLVSV